MAEYFQEMSFDNLRLHYFQVETDFTPEFPSLMFRAALCSLEHKFFVGRDFGSCLQEVPFFRMHRLRMETLIFLPFPLLPTYAHAN